MMIYSMYANIIAAHSTPTFHLRTELGHMFSHSSPQCTKITFAIHCTCTLQALCRTCRIASVLTCSVNHLRSWCSFHCNLFCIPCPQNVSYLNKYSPNTFDIYHKTYLYKYVPNNHFCTRCNILSPYAMLNLSMHCYIVYTFLYTLRIFPSTHHMTPLNSQKSTFVRKCIPENLFPVFA